MVYAQQEPEAHERKIWMIQEIGPWNFLAAGCLNSVPENRSQGRGPSSLGRTHTVRYPEAVLRTPDVQ